MSKIQTKGHCVTSEAEVTPSYGHTVPYATNERLGPSVEQVVEIAILDA
jgi:hypothetical protein